MIRPKIFAVAGWKYEPEWLVDDMKVNLSWMDKICIVDTRHRVNEFWIHEGEYRQLQRMALIDAGIRVGDWVYVTSPDERLEDRAKDVIPTLLNRNVNYVFNLCEMWTPNQYRVDGIWGNKKRPRLYRFEHNQRFSNKRIQQAPIPLNGKQKVNIDLNIYHLKMIDPESRINRVEAYKKTDPNYIYQKRGNGRLKSIDPDGKFDKMGYDYLIDEQGMILKEIEQGRGYTPDHKRNYVFKTD